MKNLQTQIQANLDVGHHVIVQDIDMHYRIISPFKDFSGNYRETQWYESVEECKQNIGDDVGLLLKRYYLDQDKYIGIYTPVYQTLKSGTKVRVREDAREWCERLEYDWHESIDSMIGKIYKITEMGSNGYLICGANYRYRYFPLQALEVITEGFEDQDTATVEYTIEEIAEKLGVDVKLLKIKK